MQKSRIQFIVWEYICHIMIDIDIGKYPYLYDRDFNHIVQLYHIYCKLIHVHTMMSRQTNFNILQEDKRQFAWIYLFLICIFLTHIWLVITDN